MNEYMLDKYDSINSNNFNSKLKNREALSYFIEKYINIKKTNVYSY